jgi:dolichyl-phosphate-mannose-protein mannosyltransferase
VEGQLPDGRIQEGQAPPHPDAEGRNPETGEASEGEASEAPPTVAVGDGEAKEAGVEGSVQGTPRPASEAKEATK